MHAGAALGGRAFAAWVPDELPVAAPAAPPDATRPADAELAADQDALVEAMALANIAREAEEADLRERIRARAYEDGLTEGRRLGREEGYLEGFADGRAAGASEEEARLRDAVRAAEQALAALRAGEAKWAGALEENICALAVAVARHVIAREVRSDPLTIAEIVRRALAEFPVDQPIRIRVHPLDLAALSTATSADGAPIPITHGRDAAWVADAQIAPGGCLVEGRDRIIDGRVDAALERLYRRLTNTHA